MYRCVDLFITLHDVASSCCACARELHGTFPGTSPSWLLFPESESGKYYSTRRVHLPSEVSTESSRITN